MWLQHMTDPRESVYYTYNIYPAIDPNTEYPEGTLRILPHTDPHSCFTLLFHRDCRPPAPACRLLPIPRGKTPALIA